MAEHPPQNPRRDYDAWFMATPDPWQEIAKLEPGGDRTFAATVESTIFHAEPAQYRALEARLLAALKLADITAPGQMFVCRMLALVGSGMGVPALVPLLENDRTADMARYALDPIDDPSVDAAYRAALGKLTGAAKTGLIASIGFRGDQQARGPLEEVRQNAAEPSDVKIAAERALQRLTAQEKTSAATS